MLIANLPDFISENKAKHFPCFRICHRKDSDFVRNTDGGFLLLRLLLVFRLAVRTKVGQTKPKIKVDSECFSYRLGIPRPNADGISFIPIRTAPPGAEQPFFGYRNLWMPVRGMRENGYSPVSAATIRSTSGGTPEAAPAAITVSGLGIVTRAGFGSTSHTGTSGRSR